MYSFQEKLNPICACGSDIETPCHYLISCTNFAAERNTLLNNTNCPYYLKFESLWNYSRSYLWRFFSKKWNKYWNFEQYYEQYSLKEEVWRFYFIKDNTVPFETLQFSFVYFRRTKILFRNFLLLPDANRVASSDCIYYVSVNV